MELESIIAQLVELSADYVKWSNFSKRGIPAKAIKKEAKLLAELEKQGISTEKIKEALK